MKSIIKTAIIAIVSIIGGQAVFASPIIVVKGKAAVWNIPNSLTTSSPALQAYPATSTDCTGIRSTITQTAHGYLYSVKIEAFENAPTDCGAVHFSYKAEGKSIRQRFTTAVRAISPPNASVSAQGALSGASRASSPVSAQGAQIGSDEDEMPACGNHIIANGKACKWTMDWNAYGITNKLFTDGGFTIRAEPDNALVQVSGLAFTMRKKDRGRTDGTFKVKGTTITGTITAQAGASVGDVNIALINDRSGNLCRSNGIYNSADDKCEFANSVANVTPITTITIVKAPPKGKIAFVPSQLVAQTDTDEQGQVLRLLVYLDAPLMQEFIGDTTTPISVKVNAVADNTGLLLDGASNKTTMTFTSAKHYGVVMVIVPSMVTSDFGDVHLSIDPASTAFYQADPVSVEIVDPTEAAPAIPPCASVDGTGATGDCTLIDILTASEDKGKPLAATGWNDQHRNIVAVRYIRQNGFKTKLTMTCNAPEGTECGDVFEHSGKPHYEVDLGIFCSDTDGYQRPTNHDAVPDEGIARGATLQAEIETTNSNAPIYGRCIGTANQPFTLRAITTRPINPIKAAI